MQIWSADLERSNGEMQVPTFHIGLSANTSFLHFQFGPDGYSRFWHAVANLGHFILSGSQLEHSTREKRGGISTNVVDGRRLCLDGDPTCEHFWRRRPVLQLVCLLSLRLPKPQTNNINR